MYIYIVYISYDRFSAERFRVIREAVTAGSLTVTPDRQINEEFTGQMNI